MISLSKTRPRLGTNTELEHLWLFPTKPKKIYLAASINNRQEATRIALLLSDLGLEVTSRWLRLDFSSKPDKNVERYKWIDFEASWGRMDLEDVMAADTLVILSNIPSSTGGYHAELGIFLGKERENILVVGGRPNVFYWTESIRVMRDTEKLVSFLTSPDHGSKEPESARTQEYA